MSMHIVDIVYSMIGCHAESRTDTTERSSDTKKYCIIITIVIHDI